MMDGTRSVRTENPELIAASSPTSARSITTTAAVTARLACSLILVWLAACAIASRADALTNCSNESIREDQASTYLPDCRAYELVSPGSKPFLESDGESEDALAALTGDSIAYFTRYAAVNATHSGFYYLASRGSYGWSADEIAPQDSPEGGERVACAQYAYFSADLSSSVLSDGWNPQEEVPGESYCQSSEEVLVPGAPAGYGNLYLGSSPTGPYQLINITPGTTTPANAQLQDMTGDLSHILFSENAQLTPEAPAGYNLYEWSEGAVHFIGVLPDGKATLAKLADGGVRGGPGGGGTQSVYEGHFNALAPVTHAVSANGERVFFYAEPEPGSVDLYLRENATQPQSAMSGATCVEPANACTTELDVSHGTGQSGGGVFWDASENGSRVFFADEHRLTANAGAIAGRPDLYEYDVETGQLTDLTPPVAGEFADVRGFSGASEDGSYFYFVAKSALTGAQENQYGAKARPHATNLYLLHEGAIMFIATLNSEADVGDWQEEADVPHEANRGTLHARVSPSGQYLGFSSIERITGFNNEDASKGTPDSEVFLYDAATHQLNCVSCGPEGTRPIGNTELPAPARFSQKPEGAPAYLSRNVLDDGWMFFSTPNALVSQDTNGLPDVYEYEEGRQYPISSGTSTAGSTFYEASPTGEDVFFVTAQGLLRSDTDNNDSIYDARANGGFVEPPPRPPGCETNETCHPPHEEQRSLISPETTIFSGPESESSKASSHKPTRKCRKGRVERHGRCVKAKRHHKRTAKRRAHR